MRTSSPLGDWLRRLLFNKINEQLTSVGTWFFWSFVSFGIWNDFKNIVVLTQSRNESCQMIHFE